MFGGVGLILMESHMEEKGGNRGEEKETWKRRMGSVGLHQSKAIIKLVLLLLLL